MFTIVFRPISAPLLVAVLHALSTPHVAPDPRRMIRAETRMPSQSPSSRVGWPHKGGRDIGSALVPCCRHLGAAAQQHAPLPSTTCLLG
ncbi:hypothetical protein C8Q80DRAFT_346436 [Daedaleopsis nitida]|nr:hypothetical protein C8Q80DRAFT_346436 [Daedaleopsis nitida]